MGSVYKLVSGVVVVLLVGFYVAQDDMSGDRAQSLAAAKAQAADKAGEYLVVDKAEVIDAVVELMGSQDDVASVEVTTRDSRLGDGAGD